LLAAVRGGLREHGYVEGSNLALEVRWAEGSFDALPALADALARSRVDLILAWATPAVLAAKRATASIPIVFFAVSDPIGSGLVASLARPGGNVTGVTNIAKDLTARQVQLLAQIAPGLRRVAIMGNPTNVSIGAQQAEAEAAARALGIAPLVISVREPDRIVSALAESEHTRFSRSFLSRPAVRERFRRYYRSCLAELERLRREHGLDLPPPRHVVFGHTHQPIPWGSDELGDTVDGNAVRFCNTGGWLLRKRPDGRQEYPGAEIVVYETGVGLHSISIRSPDGGSGVEDLDPA